MAWLVQWKCNVECMRFLVRPNKCVFGGSSMTLLNSRQLKLVHKVLKLGTYTQHCMGAHTTYMAHECAQAWQQVYK